MIGRPTPVKRKAFLEQDPSGADGAYQRPQKTEKGERYQRSAAEMRARFRATVQRLSELNGERWDRLHQELSAAEGASAAEFQRFGPNYFPSEFIDQTISGGRHFKCRACRRCPKQSGRVMNVACLHLFFLACNC
jgi:hypothetical protein